jgi:hypothetical protein
MSEVKQEGDFKMPPKKKRGRPKKLTNSAGDVKVDLAKEKEVEEVQVEDAKVEETKVEETKVEEAKVEEAKVEEQPIVELNVQEETYTPSQEQVKEAYPENVQKLVDFMKETGGDLKDYVRLSTDYSEVDQSDLLREYYKSTKPHLNGDEIDFILEDKFSVDEDLEDEKTVKKKKLAYKEEIAKAQNFLEDLKGKYYDEIKLRPGVTQEQIKANEFFNRYNKEQEIAKDRHSRFANDTKQFFDNEEFKGFEFNLGEKRFRYNVNNKESVANNQSNLNNFVEKFFNKEGNLKNYNDYHKAIYTAENSDAIANHFYEQGKADAVKDMMAKSKNIDSKPRTTSAGDVYLGGFKVKSVSGVDSSKLKLKINKK